MSLYSSLTQVLAPFAAKINGLLTGWDGTRYSTPGEAVRQQIADLHVLIGDEPGRAISASAISYGDSDVGTELTNVNGRLGDDESVIGVHHSPKIVTYTQTAFAIPQNTTITIYTLGGEELPENRLNVYDSDGKYVDYYTLNSSYGSSRTVEHKKKDVAFIALNSSYKNGVCVVWYENKTLSRTVKSLVTSDSINTIKVNKLDGIIDNGFYVYSQWANVTYSRKNTGDRRPVITASTSRASFNDLLFVRAGAKIHIEGYADRKFVRAAWTYNSNTGEYTNTEWSSWETNSIDWAINEDSYIAVVVSNMDDTTAISLSSVGIVVSVYDSYVALLESRIDSIDTQIPRRFVTEMDVTVYSIRNLLTEPCLVFPRITDIHYAPNTNVFQTFDMAVILMRILAQKVAIDFVANTGDNINGSANQNLMIEYAYHITDSFMELSAPYYFCMGNHDTNYDPGEKFTIEQTYSAFMSATKGVVFNDATNGTDFYKDFDELGIRVVFLNTQYLNAYYVADDTVTWFKNVALNTDKIIVLCEHMSTISTQNIYAQTLYNGTGITNAISDYIANGGILIQLCGHSHADYAFTSPWLSVFSTCGKFEQSDVSASAYQSITGYVGDIISPARTIGTETEQAWDVVIVRPKARKLNLVRFGAGSDREFSF